MKLSGLPLARTMHQFAMISAAIAIELRCKFDFKAFEFNYLCIVYSLPY